MHHDFYHHGAQVMQLFLYLVRSSWATPAAQLFPVVDPGFVERGVVRPWDPSKGRVLDQGDVPPPAQSVEAFSNYIHT